jgi:hypothetical protein
METDEEQCAVVMHINRAAASPRGDVAANEDDDMFCEYDQQMTIMKVIIVSPTNVMSDDDGSLDLLINAAAHLVNGVAARPLGAFVRGTWWIS